MSTGKDSMSQAEVDAKLNLFESRIDDLKHAYDMYFNGMDRRPPNQLHKEVSRMLLTLQHKTFIQNTAQKFRLRSLSARYMTYKTQWDRIMRQIEEGTYSRDRFKAKKKAERQKKLAEEQAQIGPIELDLDLDAIDDLDMFAQSIPELKPEPIHQPQPTPQTQAPYTVNEDVRAQKIRELQEKLGITQSGPQPTIPRPAAPRQTPPQQPAATAHTSSPPSAEDLRKSKLDAMRRRLEQRAQGSLKQAVAQQPASSPSNPRGMTIEQLRQLKARKDQQQARQASQQDARVQQVYRNLIEAKRRCNEPTDNLSYESVARSMAQQRERLRQTHNASDVDFKVVIKSGKAYLKPEPK